jgi:D-mannonate dehydratase
VTYAGFELEENWKQLPPGTSGVVSSGDYWERITQFLTKVIPVARQYDVRMACHPYDPPGLPFGYQGAENWDSPSIFDAIRRYEKVVDSPHNGFQLCLGTTAEGLKNPRTEVLPIVRYLGERGKIYQIHMRNIRGSLGKFEEVVCCERLACRGRAVLYRRWRMALRSQPAGVGFKPPQAAGVKSPGGERCGKGGSNSVRWVSRRRT